MKKTIAVITITLLGAIILLPFLLLINIYSDLYPKSYNIQITKPGIGKYVPMAISSAYKTCGTLGWGIHAKTNESLRTLQDYYRNRFDEYAYYPDVNTFSPFTITGTRYGIFVIKYVWTFTPNISPLAYKVSTEIAFCTF